MEGHIVLTKSWAKSAWDTKAKVSPADYSAYRSQFIFDVQTVIWKRSLKSWGSYRNKLCTS